MNIRGAFRGMFHRNKLDDDFRESYRNVLFGQYRSLGNNANNPAAQQEADGIIKMQKEEIEWEDLYRLELAIIKLEPEQLLRRRAWILRNEYKEVASPEEYKDYVESAPPKGDADLELLRADLVRLQEELNWRYIANWVVEAYRTMILNALVRTTLLVFVVSLGFIYWGSSVAFVASWTGINLPLLGAIVVPGMIGGLISIVRRIQAAHFGNNADIDLTQLEQGHRSVLLSPFLGGVFALVLFFLFAGGAVTGDLFPKVDMDSLMVSGLENLKLNETAKLIVWSFLAGFAEKLVPDRLESMARKAEDNPAASKGPQRMPVAG